MDIWIVDLKSKAPPESAMPQDGSEFYYARCAVLARTEENAIAQLTDHLSEDHIQITEPIHVRLADAEVWRDDDDYEVLDSIEEAQASNTLRLPQTSHHPAPQASRTDCD